MPEPLYVKGGPYNAYPVQLKARQPTYISIRSTGSIECVNLDRKGRFWARLDGQEAEPLKPNNFVVFLSRRFSTNNSSRTICLYAEQDVWVTVEGTSY